MLPTRTPDAELIARPQARFVRAQLATYLVTFGSTLDRFSTDNVIPSYMADALATVRAAFDRWTAEEKAL